MVSVTVEDYLVTIYRLEEVMGIAKTGDIAEELGVKPATVTKTAKTLASHGYVTYQRYRGLRLSSKGRRIAGRIIYRHRVAETFLHRILGFDIFKCHELAHSMEHLPDEIIDALYRYMGFPKRCPHGNWILGISKMDKALSLDRCPVGKTCVVEGIRGELRTVMETLREAGLGMGDAVRIIARDRRTVSIVVGGKTLDLPIRVAMSLMVSEKA